MNEWTPSELAILREHAGKKCAREIAAIVGRPRFATLAKLSKLGLPGFAPGRQCTWTREQFEALHNVQPGASSLQFARQHGLSDESVRHWARKHGIVFQPASRWTREQEQQLRELAPIHTAHQLAAIVGHSPSAIWSKAHVLGIELVREGPRPPKGTPPKPRPVKGPKPVPAIALCRPPKPAKAVKPKAAPKAPKPIQKPVPRYVSRLEWCPACHSPVSNWQEHYERMGHRRPAA